MRLEDDRLQKERARIEAEKLHAAEIEAKKKREADARDAKLALEREARMRDEERAGREEAARLAAMREAIVERARAEGLARAEAERRREELSRATDAIRTTSVAKSPSATVHVLLGVAIGFAIASLVGFTSYGMITLPHVRAEREALQREVAEQAKLLNDERSERLVLEDRVQRGNSRIEALENERKILRAAPTATSTPTPIHHAPTPPSLPPPVKKTTCAYQGDPLCSDL